jgi:hypothetical protein
MQVGAEGSHLGAINRFAVCSEEHGVRHLGSISLAGIFFVLAEDLVSAGRSFLSVTSGYNIKIVYLLAKPMAVDMFDACLSKNGAALDNPSETLNS